MGDGNAISNYITESEALDKRILEVIHAWHHHGAGLSDVEFNGLALDIFEYQLRYNKPYAQYCASRGITSDALPASWEQILPVPSAAYKEATLATFDPARAALTFQTSGTTQGTGGKHYMETSELYDAALLATFDRLVLARERMQEQSTGKHLAKTRFRYFNLVPNPAERPHSSLGYMMGKISLERGDGESGWYIHGDDLLLDAFVYDLETSIAEDRPVFLAGTAFAFVQLCDVLQERGIRFSLPPHSLVMETGGFKGRSRIVRREDLYAAIADRFGLPESSVFAEYGMTELTSQYYDLFQNEPMSSRHVSAGNDDDTVAASAIHANGNRIKVGPPWLRTRAVGVDGTSLPHGVVGALAHIDLANRSSCLAIQTEDLGATVNIATAGDIHASTNSKRDAAVGLILLGREQGAALRGCSLDAESLRTAVLRHPR